MSMGPEYCTSCANELEVGQIGLCDSCQDDRLPWSWYCLTVKHDAGEIDIYNFAPSEGSAKRAVMAAERCPERAILKIEQKDPPKEDVMSNENDYEYTCPRCGNHEFQITVEQQVRIEFTEDGDHEVDDFGPHGDIEWDNRSEACCTECEYIAPLGKMQPEVAKADVVARVVEQIKQEILADVANGQVPYFVSSFRDLQDYVDANAYGNLEDLCGGDSEAYCRFANEVHDQVDAWLVGGGIPHPDKYARPEVRIGCHVPFDDPDGRQGSVSATTWDLLRQRLERYAVTRLSIHGSQGHSGEVVFDVENDQATIGNAVATAIITLRQAGLEVPEC